MSDFGDLIRQRREEKRITLRAFAKQVGVSGAYLSKMERGMDYPPSPDKIKRMAEVLELDADELLAVAKKVDPEVRTMLREQPRIPAFLRSARDRHVTVEELEQALQHVLSNRETEGKDDGHG